MDFDFWWNAVQARQITGVRNDLRQTGDDIRRARNENIDMEAELERLSMTCRAMWELCSERLGLGDRELIDKVHEIDLRDGQRDGRFRSVPQPCPRCARTNGAHRPRCLYCGTELPQLPGFQR